MALIGLSHRIHGLESNEGGLYSKKEQCQLLSEGLTQSEYATCLVGLSYSRAGALSKSENQDGWRGKSVTGYTSPDAQESLSLDQAQRCAQVVRTGCVDFSKVSRLRGLFPTDSDLLKVKANDIHRGLRLASEQRLSSVFGKDL